MAKFIITWNCGYGPCHDVVEAADLAAATEHAYDAWREDAESGRIPSQAEYKAEPWSEELAADVGLD